MAACGLFAGVIHAQTFLIPEFRGDASTAYDAWESFTSAYGTTGNTPDQSSSTSFTSAVLTQSNESAFLTSGGNIYSFSDITSFEIAFTTSFDAATVVLQLHTLGSTVDYDSVSLSYFDGTSYVNAGSAAVVTLYSESYESGFGTSADEIVQFTWSVVATGTQSDFIISFSSAASSMSLDAVSLDASAASAVPEPAAWVALIGAGALAIATGRRPRKST